MHVILFIMVLTFLYCAVVSSSTDEFSLNCSLLEWLISLEIRLYCAFIIWWTMIIEQALVPTESMIPTIQKGSDIFFTPSALLVRKYRVGDIVVFIPVHDLFVDDGCGGLRKVERLVKRIERLEVRN